MLKRTGYVRDYHIEIDASGITGRCHAPARLVRQSLSPVLRARNIEWSIVSETGQRPGSEDIVTVRLTDTR